MSGENKPTLREIVAAMPSLAPDTIGDRLGFSLLEEDDREGKYVFLCRTAPWMANAAGTLHGGMSAAAVDQAMGFVVYYIQPGPGFSPTAQMQLEYHRPLTPGKDLRVTVWVVSRGRTLMHLRAEAAEAEKADRLCVSATGVYQYVPSLPQKKL